MSGSHCIPGNETVQPPYFQNRIIMFCLTFPPFIYLWEIYIFPGLVCLFAAAKYVERSWEYINPPQTHECGNLDWRRAILRNGIHKWDFRCSVDFLQQIFKGKILSKKYFSRAGDEALITYLTKPKNFQNFLKSRFFKSNFRKIWEKFVLPILTKNRTQ
jgi:hypothetical protein